MVFEDCLDLESRAELVAAARVFVRSRLAAWEVAELTDTATVVASELVTNAVLHARTSIQLRLSWNQPVLRIEVFDENPRLPTIAPPLPEATSGRGLALLTGMATGWGIESRDNGKVVWAEIGGGPLPSAGDGDCVDLSDVNSVDEALHQVRRADPEPSA